MSDQEIRVCDWIASFLADKDVPAAFHLSGGMITFIMDSIATLGKTPIINNRHEQAAGFAAEAATRVTGRSAVALATSGPGATNLLTAIASSYFDSTPTIFITGQVNTAEIRINSHQRQNGFQELDIVEMVKGITKYATSIKNASEVEDTFETAWSIANNGRPGPVLIDIPIDVQQKNMPEFDRQRIDSYESTTDATDFINRLQEALKLSKKPLVVLGGGVKITHSESLALEILEKMNVPFVTSLMGVGSIESSHPLNAGMLGSYGNRWANRAVAQADLLIVLSSRLDVRQTGSSIDDFIDGKIIFRVDVDEHELNGRVPSTYILKTELKIFLLQLQKINTFEYAGAFKSAIDEWKNEFPQANEQLITEGLNPSNAVELISKKFHFAKGFISDVGQHQMWAAQSCAIGPNQQFHTSGGMGAMGFSIPAAIGAAIASPGTWVVFIGDGCMQLTLGELQTIKDLNLPISIFVFNNNQHGMVAQFQESNLDSRYIGTRVGYSTPDFVRVAKSIGINALHVSSLESLILILESIKPDAGPRLYELAIPIDAKALPKMDYKSSILDL